MTVLGFLSVLAVCATVLRVVHVADQRVATVTAALGRRWRDAHVVERQRVVVLERELALREAEMKREAEKPKDDPMPSDLVDRILAWEDEFAQDAERKAIQSLYAEYRDWQRVREKLPALTPSMAVDTVAAPREALFV